MKKRIWHSVLFWVLLAETALLIILFFMGFRITYAPQMENNWDAVSAVAAWAGVLGSCIATIIAIHVPKKIAKQQNEIALFEKRYEVYQKVYAIVNVCYNLNNYQDFSLDELSRILLTMLQYESPEDPASQLYSANVHVQKILLPIRQSEFLFPGIEEEDITDLCNKTNCFFAFLFAERNQDPKKKFEEFPHKIKEEFIMSAYTFQKKYMDTIVGYIELTKYDEV